MAYEFPEQRKMAWRELIDRIVQALEDVWVAVKDILCYDSPEGHIPEDNEQNSLDIGVKDTLSFSWRALKESR